MRHECSDFDADCFDIKDPHACQRGREDETTYTPQADGPCPMIDSIKEIATEMRCSWGGKCRTEECGAWVSCERDLAAMLKDRGKV
jgi:hypothetical protein